MDNDYSFRGKTGGNSNYGSQAIQPFASYDASTRKEGIELKKKVEPLIEDTAARVNKSMIDFKEQLK